MAVPMVTMAAAPSNMPGIMIQQTPLNMTPHLVAAPPSFPTDQPYQGQITNLEFHQQGAPAHTVYATAQPQSHSHAGVGRHRHHQQAIYATHAHHS